MSLISNLLDRLSDFSDSPRLSPDEQRLISEAMDTIEAQSAKLVAHNLHGGWIPCEEWLPEAKNGYCTVITVNESGYVQPMEYEHVFIRGKETHRWKYLYNRIYNGLPIIYWMPLPEPPERGDAE